MNHFNKDFLLLIDGIEVTDGSEVAEERLEQLKKDLIQSFNESDCEDYREFIEEMNKTIDKVDNGDTSEFEGI